MTRDLISFKDGNENDYLKDPGSYLEFINPKHELTRKSKIELAGDHVVKHLLKLCIDTDLSYTQMADRLNKDYNLELSKSNVVYFLRTNYKALEIQTKETKYLNELRAKKFLEHNKIIIEDIKKLDKNIEEVENSSRDILDKSAMIVKLIDQKGRMLMRYAKLKGDIIDNPGTKVNVNIFQKMNDEKSDIIQRLKKVEFKENEQVIDV